MSYKNFFFRSLLFVYDLFPKKTPADSTKKFLVVSTTALGDTIWATPAICNLKKTYPNCAISILTSPIGSQVLRHNPYIDDVFLLKNSSLFTFLKLYFQMKKKSFTTALLFHTSQRPILPFCYLLGIPEIIGTEGLQKGLDDLLSTQVEKKPIHEIERRLEIVEKAGAQRAHTNLEIFPQDVHYKKAEEWLKRNNIDSSLPLIIMHPGAKDAFKQWDPSCFVKLGKIFQENLPCNLLVTGTAKEKPLVEQVTKNLPGSIAFTENFDLLAFAALLEKSSLLIIGDTGPMHVALALKKPTVALFCATNPLLCGPYPLKQDFVRVIAKAPTCLPCIRKKCTSAFCLLQISPKEVYENAMDLLEKNTISSS